MTHKFFSVTAYPLGTPAPHRAPKVEVLDPPL